MMQEMQCKGSEGCGAPERKNRHFLFAINQSVYLFRSNKFGALQTGHRLMMNMHGSNRTNADLAAVELRCQAFFSFSMNWVKLKKWIFSIQKFAGSFSELHEQIRPLPIRSNLLFAFPTSAIWYVINFVSRSGLAACLTLAWPLRRPQSEEWA